MIVSSRMNRLAEPVQKGFKIKKMLAIPSDLRIEVEGAAKARSTNLLLAYLDRESENYYLGSQSSVKQALSTFWISESDFLSQQTAESDGFCTDSWRYLFHF